jgi:glucose-1-phosphate cytidylyltransferase
MVEIGDRPILWHIMKLYAHQGFDEFIVTLGYRGEVIKRYFHDVALLDGDLTMSLRDGNIRRRGGEPADPWTIHLVETGLHTQTGGRLAALRPWLREGTFMLTYGDGVSNIDLRALLDFHRSHGKLATVTAVRPPARFGEFVFDGDKVTRFVEKSQIGEGWINGGFFVLEPQVLDFIPGDVPWERQPLERLAEAGELMAFRHDGFWQCMDTLRDRRLLEELWATNRAPWRIWP